jgi:glycosyltransferase involved in cell wall biosynthesis
MPPILREFPGWRLQLIGVGEGFKKEKWFPRDVLPRIDVIPAVREKTALADLYRRMAIFVLPSRYESFGLALAEAMACGCAAVATKVGYALDLSDGVDVLHIDEGASRTLTACVRELIVNEELRNRLGSAAAERARRLSWCDSVARYETLLDTWQQAVADRRN